MSTGKRTGLSLRSAWAADQPIGYLMQKALENPELVSLAAGFVDQASLPVEATRSAALSLLGQPEVARAALQYGTCAGDPALRSLVAQRVASQDAESRAPTPSAEHTVLTAGSNQLLYLLCETLLDPGDVVICDAPTYFVFMGIVKNMGAIAVGIPSDEGGMQLGALEAELERFRAQGELARVKAIYVMSSFDNPRAVSLSPERRKPLVELAKRFSLEQPIYVIEDAAYRELRYAGEDGPSLRAYDESGEHVVYAGTFSKSFSPGVRVGFGILPRELLGPLLDIKGNFDFGSPHLNQLLVREALVRGLYEPHVERLREVYRRKLDTTLAVLDEHLAPLEARYLRPQGGLYVWVELPEEVDTGARSALFARCIAEGVLYVPGAYFFPSLESAPRNCMRLSFGVPSDERIVCGVERLARALRAVRS